MKMPNYSYIFRHPNIAAVAVACTLQFFPAVFLSERVQAQEGSPGGSEGTPAGTVFSWTNLQSDIAGVAQNTDPNLSCAWGLALNPYTNNFWIADDNTGASTGYQADGTPVPLVPSVTSPVYTVTIPLASTIVPTSATYSGASSWPTGIVFNPPTANGFLIGANAQPATLLFAAESGTISGWNADVNLNNAIIMVDNSASGAVYKGLALATLPSGDVRLYATDFHNGKVDVFDSTFNPVTTAGGFVDPNLPAGFAPFGIANINGLIYVTYAKQQLPAAVEEDNEPGNGFVDAFDLDGNLQQRLISQGPLNSPWGLAVVPTTFGKFGAQTLLVGNYGDGHVNAFDISSGVGAYVGTLQNAKGQPIAIDSLFALYFYGSRLYFTAGIASESHGLFGYIVNVQ